MIDTTRPGGASVPGKAANIVLCVLQVLTALAFAMAGIVKLAGNPEAVAVFETIGLGQWFRYFTGAVEAGSAVLLLIPAVTPVGALLLMCTMAAAVITHLFVIGGSPAGAIACFVVAAIIAWGRRGRLMALLSAWRA